MDPVDAVEEDLREEVVPLGGPDPGLARARGWVGGRVGLGHTHGWGQWSLVTVSALLRGVFIFISVLWRPSPQCPSVAQPLCPQTCRHADTTGRYGTSWIFATLVYSMNAIKRLHISSYGSLCNIVLYQYLKFGRLHKPKIIYSKFLYILNCHIHMFIC